MAECIQCGKPAVVGGLCVEHYYMFQQAIHNQMSWHAAMYNLFATQIDAATGYLGHASRIQIPKPPSTGGSLTQNYINISESMIGVLNTGTISNLNNGIAIIESRGQTEIAEAIKEFTEAVDESKQVTESAKKEIIEQLDVLLAQLNAEPENRSIGLIKSILAGIKNTVAVSAALLTLWDKLAPILQASIN